MEFVVSTAALAVGIFVVIAVVAMLFTAFSSKPNEAGHLQPRFPLRAQGWTILVCVVVVPLVQRIFESRMNEQEQINSFLVTAVVLSLLWLMLLSRHVRLVAR